MTATPLIQPLIRQVRELELIGRKNVTGLFAGNYISALVGQGLEFHEARKYVTGESVRNIDWNMSARLNDVHVKTYREEREREVFLVVDASPSLFFGTQQKTKYECALELAATLGFAAIASGDKLGLVIYSDTVVDFFPPQKNKAHFYNILKRLVALKNEKRAGGTDIRSAIQAIESLSGREFLIFVISDFIEDNLPDDLRLIRQRHDVTFLHLYDPFEFESDRKILFPLKPAEGAGQISSGRPGDFNSLERMESTLKGASYKHGIDILSISTKEIVHKKLMGLFRKRQKRRSR